MRFLHANDVLLGLFEVGVGVEVAVDLLHSEVGVVLPFYLEQLEHVNEDLPQVDLSLDLHDIAFADLVLALGSVHQCLALSQVELNLVNI